MYLFLEQPLTGMVVKTQVTHLIDKDRVSKEQSILFAIIAQISKSNIDVESHAYKITGKKIWSI